MATETFPYECVKPLRVFLGFTQIEFAEKLGVSQPLIALWESGQRTPIGPAAILLGQLYSKNEKKMEASC